ncbi:MAG: cache domain-containing protein [Dehalococcoidales bacterium]|nr:cache domain-containing protein [Dehalococcoidales bacterium]
MLAKSGLQKRIVLLVSIGMLTVFALLGTLSALAVDESVRRTLQDRLDLAEASAQHVDYVLKQNIDLLQGATFFQGVDLEDANLDPERRALHDVYFHTIFGDGVYIVDKEGRVLWREPSFPDPDPALSEYPHVRKALETGKPVVSDIYVVNGTGRPVVSIVIPVKNASGKLVGLVGGDVDLTSSNLQKVIQPVGLGPSGYVQVVDSKGVVIAASSRSQILTESDHSNRLENLIRQKKPVVSTCHDCHASDSPATAQATREAEVMAFVPLQTAPWGLVIRESEREALAPARRLQQQFLLFGVPVFLISVALAWGTAQSVIRPIVLLTRAAEKISNGNLSDSTPYLGEDEIGRLALTFDEMRVKLKDSLENFQRLNKELESRVEQRTGELREKERTRGELLRKVISAQEDERKRLARELHDETSQSLAALVVALDATAVASFRSKVAVRKRIERIRSLAVRTLEEINKLIFDLRPSLLDDLGLIPAIQWYAESRLASAGVKVHVETVGDERRLPPEIETALYRAVQEAITNIAKHAHAENVSLTLDFDESGVTVEIEDDGDGFDVQAVSDAAAINGSFGLLGMRERISLLDGELEVSSEPGSGTRIRLVVPLWQRGDLYAENKSVVG